MRADVAQFLVGSVTQPANSDQGHTSHGPVDRKRLAEFEALLGSCRATPVHVSAFPDFDEFRKHVKAIAWETEVWLAEVPDHLIHFDGDRFLKQGAREQPTRRRKSTK